MQSVAVYLMSFSLLDTALEIMYRGFFSKMYFSDLCLIRSLKCSVLLLRTGFIYFLHFPFAIRCMAGVTMVMVS